MNNLLMVSVGVNKLLTVPVTNYKVQILHNLHVLIQRIYGTVFLFAPSNV